MPIIVKAPAKINLTLDCMGLREDGYHLLKSVMQTVSLYDTLTLTPANHITLTVEGADVGAVEKNTAYKAACLFFAETGVSGGVAIHLKKAIPTQAGMGGGSADAAGVLLGLNRLYGTHLTTAQLVAMGVHIGADVPFCLVGGTALCEGIGEVITPLPALPDCHIVIAQPADGVSTGEAYARLDSQPLRDRPAHEAMAAALTAGDLPAIGAAVANVFQPALAIPAVEAIGRDMAAFRPLGCRMTGSGSVVYALFDNETTAAACCDALAATWPVAALCHPCRGVEIFSE